MADKQETKEKEKTINETEVKNNGKNESEPCKENGEKGNGNHEKKEESPKEEPIIIPETHEQLVEAFVEVTKKSRQLEKEIEKLKEANNRLMKEYDGLNDKYYLLGAELHNKEKVLNKQLEIKTKNYQRQVLSQFFPIVESLQSALNMKSKLDSIDNPVLKNFIAGIENIHKNIVSIYENNDVREIPIEIGKTKFNVIQHEVVYQHTTPDYDDDVIIQVTQKGYMIGNEVLRPAKVTVAKNAEKEKEREKKAEEMRKKREEQRKKEQEEREKQRKEEEERKKKEEEEKKKNGNRSNKNESESPASKNQNNHATSANGNQSNSTEPNDSKKNGTSC